MAFRSTRVVMEVFQSLPLVPEKDVVDVDDDSQGEAEEEDEDEGGEDTARKMMKIMKMTSMRTPKRKGATLPYTEHRKVPSKETMQNPELKGGHESYMSPFAPRRTGNQPVDELSVTAVTPDKQNPIHKRILSAFSDMTPQPKSKKPSVPNRFVS
jgi:hypothetical protein